MSEVDRLAQLRTTTRTFRFRLYPTTVQATALDEMVRDHRRLYNAALQERRDAWRMRKVSVSFAQQSAQMPAIRAFDPEQERWSATSQQQTLRRLDKAFSSFFKRVKAGQTPGFPRYKSAQRYNTVTFTEGNGSKWLGGHICLQGAGVIKVKVHRPVPGTVKQLSVTRDGAHWYVNVICTGVLASPRSLTGAVVGLDRGITHLLADSDGGFVANLRHTRKAATGLAVAQQDLDRKKRGSKRRRKAIARVVMHHRKVRNTRKDWLHKVSRNLVDTYDVIALEDLRVKNMIRRPKPLPDNAPNGAAAKAGLNKSILDAGWSNLARMIEYKAESAGTQVVYVPAANTSRTCHACGHCHADNRNGEAFNCRQCGHSAHADTNAALNILRLGLSRQEADNAA